MVGVSWGGGVVGVPFGGPFLANGRTRCVCRTIVTKGLSNGNRFAGVIRRCFRGRCNFHGYLLAASYASTLRVTTVLAGINPKSRIVIPDCAFMSSTLTFIHRKTAVMFTSDYGGGPGVSTSVLRDLVASHAGMVMPIRCTNMTYSVSHVVSVTGGRGVFIIRSTTRTISDFCGKETLNSVKRLKYFSFRRAGGVVTNRNKVLTVGSRHFVHHTRVV